jgi:hypothetical protein
MSRPLCLILTLTLITTTAHAAQRAKLAIVSATYGDLASGKTIDVTKKVADRVKDENLSLEVTKETFGDPAPGAANKLKVGYTIDGLYHTKTVDQGETLDISSRLIILRALYGDLPKGKSDDVTDQVADLVRKNTLTVKADNETFGDPAANVVKKLKVDYLFDGVKASKTIAENETLTISDKGK